MARVGMPRSRAATGRRPRRRTPQSASALRSRTGGREAELTLCTNLGAEGVGPDSRDFVTGEEMHNKAVAPMRLGDYSALSGRGGFVGSGNGIRTRTEPTFRLRGIEFETAILVFSDPLAATVEDPYRYEQRWRTVGVVGTAAIMVVHSSPEADPETGEEVGRIISARKLTRRERRRYEEGHV